MKSGHKLIFKKFIQGNNFILNNLSEQMKICYVGFLTHLRYYGSVGKLLLSMKIMSKKKIVRRQKAKSSEVHWVISRAITLYILVCDK